MASFTGTHPYSFQRPSTIATRVLVSEMNPTSLPSASSNDGPGSGGVTSQPQGQSQNASTVGSSNYTQAASDGPITGKLERQQSWKLGDKKREATEQLLAGKGPGQQGYSSTAGRV
nr:hypothetical protein CFP56_16925 [Quercus suber]